MKVKLTFILFPVFLAVLSCSQNDEAMDVEVPSMDEPLNTQDSTEEMEGERFAEMYCDTTTVKGGKYQVCYNGETPFFILNESLDTVYKHDEWVTKAQFVDFNHDGFDDVLVDYMGNVPGFSDLLLFDPGSNEFRIVKGFTNFPVPTHIEGAEAYYSYHRSGCAGSNWDSDLFLLEDFKAIRVGNISGVGCSSGGKTGIFISKVDGAEKQLIKEILREPGYYEDKWDFISSYWSKNHQQFKR